MVGAKMSTGGEVANALVCKTSIRGFNSRPVLQSFNCLVGELRLAVLGSVAETVASALLFLVFTIFGPIELSVRFAEFLAPHRQSSVH